MKTYLILAWGCQDILAYHHLFIVVGIMALKKERPWHTELVIWGTPLFGTYERLRLLIAVEGMTIVMPAGRRKLGVDHDSRMVQTGYGRQCPFLI